VKRIDGLLKRFLLVALLLVATSPPAFCFTLELMKAAEAVSAGTASKKQEALVFKHNAEINRMRMKDFSITELVNGQKVRHSMTDEVYQKCQNLYSEKNLEIARQAAAENGAGMNPQRRDRNRPFDAGTDSDYIVQADSPEQIKAIRDTYNRKVNGFLEQNGVDPEKIDYARKNDVDFMADPGRVNAADFERIAGLNNDAYKRRDAAMYEAKSRSGETPGFDEIMAYKDEMDDFVQKKTREIEPISRELRDHRKQYPDERKEPLDAHRKRIDMEARLQQKQAQKSKYHDRAQNATLELARQAGLEDIIRPQQSGLPAEGRTRAPSETVSQKQQQIKSAAADSASSHLAYLDTLNEARILGDMAARHPENTEVYRDRILKKTEGMTPSQKGEIIARMRETGAPDRLVREITAEMKRSSDTGVRQKPTPVETPARLQKAGRIAAYSGDLLSIADQLKKAEQGQHLFFNISERDSEAVKITKKALVAAIELAPIPVIDALERGWTVDEEEKQYILEQIRKGKTVNPVASFLRVTGKVTWRAVASMTIDPLILGKDAAVEGAKAGGTAWTNWRDDSIREASVHLQGLKFEGITARARDIDLDIIFARRDTFTGRLLYGETAKEGDLLTFQIARDKKWTDRYEARWEISGPKKQKLAETSSVPASSDRANRLTYKCENVMPGDYTVTFRMFDARSKLQMDFRTYVFRVAESDQVALGPIRATLNSFEGPALKGAARIGDILAFQSQRSGKWGGTHEVQWLVNGENYKTATGDDPKANLLRFDTTGMAPAAYTIAVRLIDTSGKTRQIIAHQDTSFRLVTNVIAMDPFQIRASLNDYDGPPLPASVQNGDILAFQADLKHPAGKPEPAQLFWQVYDGSGKPVPGLGKQEQVYESGATRNHRFKIRLDKLADGEYSVGLTHVFNAVPGVKVNAVSRFRIAQAVRIDRVLATDSPDDQTHKALLPPDREPLLYAHYTIGQGIKKATLTLTAKDAKGQTIETVSMERPRPGETPPYRVGLAVPAGKIPAGEEITFEASIVARNGQRHMARTTFTKDVHRLVLNAPKSMKNGENRTFSITVPRGFKGPFVVDVRASGKGLSVGHTAGSLHGTVGGIAGEYAETGNLIVKVTDAGGNSASAQAAILIEPSGKQYADAQPPAPKPMVPVSPSPVRTPSPIHASPSHSGIESSPSPEAKRPAPAPGIDYAAVGRQHWEWVVNNIMSRTIHSCLRSSEPRLYDQFRQQLLGMKSVDYAALGRMNAQRLADFSTEQERVFAQRALYDAIMSHGLRGDCPAKMIDHLTRQGLISHAQATAYRDRQKTQDHASRASSVRERDQAKTVYWVVLTSVFDKQTKNTRASARVVTGNQPPSTGFSAPNTAAPGHYFSVTKAYGTLDQRKAQEIAGEINRGGYRDVFPRTRYNVSGHIGKGLEGRPLVTHDSGVPR